MKNSLSLLLCLFLSQVGIAQKEAKPSIFANTNGAIKGYDPVAYHTQSKPVKGTQNIAYEWKGATWHFATEENRTLFVQNPEKYAPQYGGYCAYGWAQGYPAKTEPDAWTIVEGKLYLNYNKSVQADWEKDIPGYIKKADENYQKKQGGGNSN